MSRRAWVQYRGEKCGHLLAEVVTGDDGELVIDVKRLSVGAVGRTDRKGEGGRTAPLRRLEGSFPTACACGKDYVLRPSEVRDDVRAGTRRVMVPALSL